MQWARASADMVLTSFFQAILASALEKQEIFYCEGLEQSHNSKLYLKTL